MYIYIYIYIYYTLYVFKDRTQVISVCDVLFSNVVIRILLLTKLYIIFYKSDLKWCFNLSRSLFLYFNYLVSVTAGGPRSPRGHM